MNTAEKVAGLSVGGICEEQGLSQAGFSQRYGLSLSTVRSWVKSWREPRAPALILLYLIKTRTSVVREAVLEMRQLGLIE